MSEAATHDIEADRAQVIAQCKAVAHLCDCLAGLHRDLIKYYEIPNANEILDMAGDRTAGFLETLSDIINGMDAFDADEDEWVNPIIEAAHKRWPQDVPTRTFSS